MKNLITCLTVSLLSGATFATTWTVDDDGKADFDNIQAAVDAASDGDEIVVMEGMYYEHDINTLGKSILIEGSINTAGELLAVVHGNWQGSVFVCDSGETTSTVFKNLLITGGNALSGSGMYIEESAPSLVGCTFMNNYAIKGLGGGMHNWGSSPTLTNCTFTGNAAGGSGGGMYNAYDSNPTLTNCTFESNTADSTGGGMYNSSSNPTLTNCTFTNNTAGNNGGGIYTRSSIGLLNCTFVNNSANAGGAIYVMGDKWAMPHCILENCTLQNNDGNYGGGIYSADAYLTLGNCLVTGNNGSGLRNDMMGILSLSFTTVCANLPEQIIGSWENQSGNWVNIDCPPEEGACCTDNNIVCTVSTELTCMQFGGDWKGENIDCADSECAIPCLGDVTGDGQVDVSDILVIISVWGACP